MALKLRRRREHSHTEYSSANQALIGGPNSRTNWPRGTIPKNVNPPVKAERHRFLARLHLAVLRHFRRAARRRHADSHWSERAERFERHVDRRVLVARGACAEQGLWCWPRRREDVE